jgi:hypothetical protein
MPAKYNSPSTSSTTQTRLRLVLRRLTLLFMLSLLALPACDALRLPNSPSQPGQRPVVTLSSKSTQPAGKVQVITADSPSQSTPQGTATPLATAKTTGAVSVYDAAKVISTFSAQALGVTVTVPRVDGVMGEVRLPQTASTSVNKAASLAGFVTAGTVTSDKGLSGVSQVALGRGKVSGDMNLDISSASLGAVSLISKAQAPAASMQALALVRQTFPALGAVTLSEISSAGGMYVFEGSLNKMGPDWKSRQTTMLSARILAGAGKMGADVIVWAMVANGELSTVK